MRRPVAAVRDPVSMRGQVPLPHGRPCAGQDGQAQCFGDAPNTQSTFSPGFLGPGVLFLPHKDSCS